MTLPPDRKSDGESDPGAGERKSSGLVEQAKELERKYGKQSRALLSAEDDVGTIEYLPLDISRSVAVPKPFTRIGLFGLPARSSIKDVDYAKELNRKWALGHDISTQFHKATSWGPPLDTYDEDVLYALMELTWYKRITAQRGRLPAKRPRLVAVDKGVAPVETGFSEIATVIVGEITAYEINSFLGKSCSADALKRTRYAILKLALISVRFDDEKMGTFGVFHLLSFIGAKDASGSLLIQWDPVIVAMRENPQMRVYIDLNVRRALSDTGSMVHRFLSSQLSNRSPHYEIGLDRLQIAIHLSKPVKYFKRDVEENMKRCVETGWLQRFDITGTGRNKPFKLIVFKR